MPVAARGVVTVALGVPGARDAVEWAGAGRGAPAGDDAPQPGSAATAPRATAEMTALVHGLSQRRPMV
ncbi:MAG TPA: hypothetical protein VIZ20_08875 [Streptosporangiaceae bacterium]